MDVACSLYQCWIGYATSLYGNKGDLMFILQLDY